MAEVCIYFCVMFGLILGTQSQSLNISLLQRISTSIPTFLKISTTVVQPDIANSSFRSSTDDVMATVMSNISTAGA